MTDPIVLRSEILSLLQTGGLGAAGTSGSESIASLNSQLISLTARIAKLEGSATYNEEAGDNFWYDDMLGVCIVSGSTVLTSSLNAGESIKLLTIDSDTHLPPTGTNFLGAACAYMSNTSVGANPYQLALSFDGLDLIATAEQYIPASSSSSWYVEYHTMWMKNGFNNSSSKCATIGWNMTSATSTDYVYAIEDRGVLFVFGYIKNANATIVKTQQFATFSNYSIGYGMNVYTKTNDTVERFGMSISNNILSSFTASAKVESVYCYGLFLSKTNGDITLGEYSKNENINSDYFYADGATIISGRVAASSGFRYNGLTYLSVYTRMKSSFNPSAAWSPVRLLTPSLLADDISANFLPLSSQVVGCPEMPVNATNGKITIQLKPDIEATDHFVSGTFIFIKKTN